MIEAYEQRNVISIDIKGEFLKAKVPDDMDLILKMEGELVELMCELDFWYKMDEKEKMEFKRNRYDPCVFNKQTTDMMI